MSDNQSQVYRVYSTIPRQGEGEDWLSIGLAVSHPDGKGFDVALQALPLNSRLILRRAFETQHGQAVERAKQDRHPESGKPCSLKQQLDAFERALIEQCLMEAGGKIAAVMERLDLPRRTLNEKMARLSIDRRHWLTGASPNARSDAAPQRLRQAPSIAGEQQPPRNQRPATPAHKTSHISS